MYRFIIKAKSIDGQIVGGGAKFKTFENAKKRINWATKQWKGHPCNEIVAWEIIDLETGLPVESSGTI